MAKDIYTPIHELPRQYRDAIDPGVSTGWTCLDRLMKGVRWGELTVVTADTGVGKTTFCTQLAVHCANRGVPVWLNSWEMHAGAIVRKVASVVLRRSLKCDAFTPTDHALFDTWCAQHRLYVNQDTTGMSVESLAENVRHFAKQGLRVVLLDHLDYLVSSRREKQHEAIEEAVRGLHEIAFSCGVHILLICHPRQSATASEEVGIHSLKGSSAIKQYADNVLVLHRCSRTDSSADPSKVKVRVAKNRMFGTEGNTYLFYQPEWDGYVELNNK